MRCRSWLNHAPVQPVRWPDRRYPRFASQSPQFLSCWMRFPQAKQLLFCAEDKSRFPLAICRAATDTDSVVGLDVAHRLSQLRIHRFQSTKQLAKFAAITTFYWHLQATTATVLATFTALASGRMMARSKYSVAPTAPATPTKTRAIAMNNAVCADWALSLTNSLASLSLMEISCSISKATLSESSRLWSTKALPCSALPLPNSPMIDFSCHGAEALLHLFGRPRRAPLWCSHALDNSPPMLWPRPQNPARILSGASCAKWLALPADKCLKRRRKSVSHD